MTKGTRMANPISIECALDTWTKVAENVSRGLVFIKEVGAVYYSTYRETGEAAPTSLDEGVRLRQPGGKIIAQTKPIDVYIWAQRLKGKVQVHV